MPEDPTASRRRGHPGEDVGMMVHVTLQESIAAPPERVMGAYLDFAGYPRWMTNVLEFELLTPGELRVGSRWRQVRRRFGDEARDEIEVRKLEPPCLYEVSVDTERDTAQHGHYVFRWEFAPQGAGTRIDLTAEGTQEGPDWEGRDEMLAHALETLLAADLASLKRHLESGA